MKDLVEQRRGELVARYLQYIEILMVQLWSDDHQIEFRCGFALRGNHSLQSFTIKVPGDTAKSEGDRVVIVVAVFKHIEALVDEAIAQAGSVH